ncbi:MAG TPA: hypothetical protein VM537_18690 [Anaerolineae bacterium]|nr:hypothetical protein [Anaerolineae bacterium]
MSSGSTEEAAREVERAGARHTISWFHIAVICALGCVLPVIAYAEAMGGVFGFSRLRRSHILVLVIVPTLVWVGVLYWHGLGMQGAVGRRVDVAAAALFLGGQLVVAIVVASLVACGRSALRRRRDGEAERAVTKSIVEGRDAD